MGEPEAAVAILRTRGPDSTILLMRRAERDGDPWSGHWSLPGGRRDDSDRDLLETALRELREECGVALGPEQVSAALPLTVARRRVGPFLRVAPFVFEIDAELPTVLDPNEAAGAEWIRQSVLLEPQRHAFHRVPGMPEEMWFPGIALPGVPLWGFTYRLLVDWLGMAPCENQGAGFAVARRLQEFLVSQGMVVRSEWERRADGAMEMRVAGTIPVEAVAGELASPGLHVMLANRVELHGDCVRVLGLEFEEYAIVGT